MEKPDTQRIEHDVDALDIYMRGVSGLGEYSAEQQSRLCQTFESCSDEVRRKICVWGFTASEYLRSISGILNKGVDPADVFVVSALRNMGSGPAAQFRVLRDYYQEISAKYEELQRVFASGGDGSALREEMTELLMRHRLTLQRCYELIDIANDYLRMIDPDFQWGKYPEVKCQDAVSFVEEKLLLSFAEVPEEMQEFSRRIDSLHQIRNLIIFFVLNS